MLKTLKSNVFSKYFVFGALFIIITSLITFLMSNNIFNDFKNGQLSTTFVFFRTVIESNIFLINLAPFAAIIASYKIIFYSNRKFILKDFFSAGIVGAFVFLFALSILLVIYFIVFKNVDLNNTEVISVAYFKNTSINSIIVISFINSIVLGFVYAQLSFSIAYGCKKKNEAIVLPIIIYLIGMYCQSYSGSIYSFLPLSNYFILSGKNQFEQLFGLLIIIPITIMILVIKILKFRNENIKHEIN